MITIMLSLRNIRNARMPACFVSIDAQPDNAFLNAGASLHKANLCTNYISNEFIHMLGVVFIKRKVVKCQF